MEQDIFDIVLLPLLLRDQFNVFVETVAVTQEMIHHVLILYYYACLARTLIGVVYVLNKARSSNLIRVVSRNHADIFGDVLIFFMSVVHCLPHACSRASCYTRIQQVWRSSDRGDVVSPHLVKPPFTAAPSL